MDKRFTLFLFVAMSIFIGFVLLNNALTPKPPAGDVADNDEDEDDGDDQGEDDSDDDADDDDANDKDGDNDDTDQDDDDDDDDKDDDDADDDDADDDDADDEPAIGAGDKKSVATREWATVGAFRGGGLPYLAFFSNRGARLDRLELVEREKSGRFVYRALAQDHGYLGFMGLKTLPEGGALVQVVGPGTPGELANADGITGGLQAGDVIVGINGGPALNVSEINRALTGLEPGEKVEVSVIRTNTADDSADDTADDTADDAGDDGETVPETSSQEINFTVTLAEKPLVLIGDDDSVDSPPRGRSAFTMAINQYKDQSGKADTWAIAKGGSLEQIDWELDKSKKNSVVFTTQFKRDKDIIEIEKSFRFSTPSKKEADDPGAQYRFGYSIRARSVSKTKPLVGFRIDGPRGLPIEGWWYLNKIHPSMFNSAGTRDVTWNVAQGGHQIRGTKAILTQAKKDEAQPFKSIFASSHVAELRELRYIGVDTAYFNVSLLPKDYKDGGTMRFAAAAPIAASDPDAIAKKRFKLCDTTFWLATEPVQLGQAKGKEWPYEQEFVVFAGPKRSDVLQNYGIEQNIYYGWFGWVAKPLSTLLHLFYAIVRNYGIAIVMLTIFVRACIFPLSRKAARNAQVMQILGPEMKKLAEKHKNDMEKRGAAQRELYEKYDFNPFGGCGLALLQLPIFMGLYRCISVDIDLRQSELIPGWSWCSNLAGPDMLWNWPAPAFLSAKTAWFGPYLNILPLVTIVLFLVQQKLFTPPATDEQTRAQQKMMKYMMIFIGVLFFKVPAGLCIYFIASSIWSIGERKLIPKPDVDLAAMEKKAAEKKKNGGAKKPGLLERAMKEMKQRAEEKEGAGGESNNGADGRSGQGRSGQGRSGQGRSGQGRSGQGRSGQGGGGQGRGGQGKGGRPPARRRRKK